MQRSGGHIRTFAAGASGSSEKSTDPGGQVDHATIEAKGLMKGTTPGATAVWFVVAWAEEDLTWADFRAKVIGGLRVAILRDWQALGLSSSENGVHASAGPLEGLAERLDGLFHPGVALQLHTTPTTNFILLAMDEKVVGVLLAKRIPVYMDKALPFVMSEAGTFGEQKFHRLLCSKLLCPSSTSSKKV